MALALLAAIGHLIVAASATNIKWTAGDNQNTEAHRAPRSQKYWDEHKIKRPDYGKTDAEVWAERLKSLQTLNPTLASWQSLLIAFVCILSAAAWWWSSSRSSSATTGGRFSKAPDLTPEQLALLREARLSRFAESNVEGESDSAEQPALGQQQTENEAGTALLAAGTTTTATTGDCEPEERAADEGAREAPPAE